jgi:3-hydroxyacyl-[acyl-carrier-protein] dehydratase
MMGDAKTDEAIEAGSVGPSIEIAEIMARLPHRYPFLLIDRCEDYRPGESIVGIKCVSVNEPYFQGHFPDNPVMPGVLIVEAMAQSGAVLMSKTLDVDKRGKTILFMTLDNVRFRLPVRPGDILKMQVRVLRVRGDIYKFRGDAFVNGKAAAEAEWAAILIENPK